MDLDEADRAIIRELQIDGRMPVAQLARVVGLSQTATRHRLQKMLNDEAIQIAVIGDPRLMGFEVEAMVGIEVDGQPREVAEAICKNSEVTNVMLTAGRFSLMVEVICKTNRELHEFLDDRVRSIESVRSLEVFIYLECTKDSYNWCNLLFDAGAGRSARSGASQATVAGHEEHIHVEGFLQDQHGDPVIGAAVTLRNTVDTGHEVREWQLKTSTTFKYAGYNHGESCPLSVAKESGATGQFCCIGLGAQEPFCPTGFYQSEVLSVQAPTGSNAV